MSEGFYNNMAAQSFFKTEPETPKQVEAPTRTTGTMLTPEKSPGSVMYPNTVFGMPETPKAPPTEDERMATAFYLSSKPATGTTQPGFYSQPEPEGVDLQLSATVLEDRAADGADAPWSAGGSMDSAREYIEQEVAAQLPGNLTDEQRHQQNQITDAYAHEWSRAAAAMGFDNGSLSAAIQAADANVAMAEAGNFTAEVVLAQRADSQRLLQERFGNEAPTALAAARALVARDRRVAAHLKRTGLEDSPAAVIPIAVQAMARYRSGKLKLPK